MAKKKLNIVETEIRKNFHKVYYYEVAPLMEKFEKERQFKWFIIFLAEMVLVPLFLYGVNSFLKGTVIAGFEFPVFLCMFLLFGVIFALPFVMSDNFSKMLKAKCMAKVVKAFGDMQWKNGAKFIKDVDLNESELFALHNKRSDDDNFSGKYNDVSFDISETQLWYESGSGKNKSVREVFKGVIINFDSNKTIKNKTIVATKGDKNIKGRNVTVWFVLIFLVTGILVRDIEICAYSIIGIITFIISAIMEKKQKKEVLKEIKLEDPLFNKKYKAYSSDEVEGRYLITPSFMERFNNIQTAFGSKNVKCSFYKEKVMFAISTNKNLFEIGNLFTPLNSPKQFERFFEELTSVLRLVDYFKLDEKTRL